MQHMGGGNTEGEGKKCSHKARGSVPTLVLRSVINAWDIQCMNENANFSSLLNKKREYPHKLGKILSDKKASPSKTQH